MAHSAMTTWRPPSEEGGDPSTGNDRILLLIESQGNRQQIGRQLENRYEVLHAHGDSLPTGGFDIAIVDGPGMRKWHGALVEAKHAQQPVFLPLILILPRTELRGRTSRQVSIIDDFIPSPIDRAEFLERVNMLLRARRQALAQREDLVRIVNYDRTTGLPNRNLFADRVDVAMHNADAWDLTLVVLVIRIPFGKVLESVGEQGVEEAASVCSRALHEIYGEDVGLARLGEEQWGVGLLTEAPMEEVFRSHDRVSRLGRMPITAGGESVHVLPRMGAALYPADASNAPGLIDAAIAAGNRAHEEGPTFYAEDLRNAALQYTRVEAGLHEALAQEQFELWLQPKVAFRTGGVSAAEALIRWRQPSGELVPPGEFIPVAEASGFIRRITAWVIQTAIRMLAEWNADGKTNRRIAVNITPVDIQQTDFLPELKQLCADHGVDRESLELELTETMLCDMNAQTVERLSELRDAGFNIAIDDFGTGYSSLAYLHQLPIRTLKIDKSFIDDIPGNGRGESVLRAIIELAHGFGLEVVAEGIETQAQLDYLHAAGVDYGQGFFIARPMPVKDFHDWLAH
jgi:EAL domain-containing protein (putative c-di-GMP-specific phosphodiesterase class I)/DNA-binding response OmpR family regulator